MKSAAFYIERSIWWGVISHEFELKYGSPAEPSTLDLSRETLLNDAQEANVLMKSAARFLRVLDAADGWDDHDWLAAADALDNAADDCSDDADVEQAALGSEQA